ncbi:FAD-dependent oxidoreductase, partial [Escherichia coli]|nr:FAD-dependent oxidoreductase [Escherichia coli]
PLSRWDSHVSSTLMRTLKRDGVRFESHSTLTGAGDGEVTYSIADPKKDTVTEKTIPADFVLAAIGRSPRTTASWLKQAGIALTSTNRVITDEYGRTNLENA